LLLKFALWEEEEMFTKVLNWYLVIILLVLTETLLAHDKESTLNIGDKAPNIVLNDQDGNLWNLKDHLGKKNIVVYFYPAAMTGGCTKQACSYRDSKDELEDLDIVVVGVSSDAVTGLKVFQQAHQLNFSLLSDASSETARNYGVPTEEGGSILRKVGEEEVTLERSYTPSRWTFIIDKNGKIVYKDTEVDAVEDSQNILEFLKSTER
jgi:peroxiredoxin Q/BCP